MAVGTDIQYAKVEALLLDPKNPRLGRRRVAENASQETLLDWMHDFTLDELAHSYIENGAFWIQEPLLVVEETLNGESGLYVVEGNRRLAALKYLKMAVDGDPFKKRWSEMVAGREIPKELFECVPYLKADARSDIQAYLGFRHVTGIKQWDADEKASFIAQLIDEEGFTYQQVMRKIGSKTPTVRQNYIAYRLLLQMEDTVEDLDIEESENRFAILYMTINTEGAQNYLQIDLSADPKSAQKPVPKDKLENLKCFATWLFGNEETEPLVTDTRQVSKFGHILNSEESITYLKSTKRPSFEVADRIAGGDEKEIVKYVEEAAHSMELALTRAHAYKASADLRNAVERAGGDALQLLGLYPDLKKDLIESAV